MFHNLECFGAQLDFVKINHIVRANHEVEVFAKAKAEVKDFQGLGKLKSQLFSLLVFDKKQNQLDR